MTATTKPTGAIVDLEGPDGGRFWRVTTGEAADHPDAISAAVHARVTGSVGATYNGVHVDRVVPAASDQYREQAQAVVIQAQAIADGTVTGPLHAAVRRLLSNVETLVAWTEDDRG